MPPDTYSAFAEGRLIASGDLHSVAASLFDRGDGQALVLSDKTGGVIDLDLRGPAEAVAARYRPESGPSEAVRTQRGRPRLGVVAKEVTLLPRHWDWLATRPGGASAALRKLVDQARRETEEDDLRRAASDRAYKAMHALAGDLPGYEEALRAMYSGDCAAMSAAMGPWPADIRAYVLRLLETA